MMIIKSLLFVLFMYILPIYLGDIFIFDIQEKEKSIALRFVSGIMLMFSSFYIIAIILTVLRQSLTLLTVIWCGSILLYILCGVCSGRYTRLKKDSFNLKGFRIKWDEAAALFLIAFQIIYVCIMAHTDADDATYVGMATTSFYTDTLNQYNPLTGAETDVPFHLPYGLSPFPIFWAMFGKLFNLHPAIIMHSLCPAILISLAYMVYYLIGKQILEEKKNLALFMIFISLVNIWGKYSIRAAATFLLFRIWQGKAVVAVILIPLVYYVLLQIKRKKEERIYNCLLILCSISACLASGMGIILMGGQLALCCFIELLYSKNMRIIKKYILAEMPFCLVGVLYLTILKL